MSAKLTEIKEELFEKLRKRNYSDIMKISCEITQNLAPAQAKALVMDMYVTYYLNYNIYLPDFIAARIGEKDKTKLWKIIPEILMVMSNSKPKELAFYNPKLTNLNKHASSILIKPDGYECKYFEKKNYKVQDSITINDIVYSFMYHFGKKSAQEVFDILSFIVNKTKDKVMGNKFEKDFLNKIWQLCLEACEDTNGIIKHYYKIFETLYNKTNRVKLINLLFFSVYIAMTKKGPTYQCLMSRDVMKQILYVNQYLEANYGTPIELPEEDDMAEEEKMMYLKIMVNYDRDHEADVKKRITERLGKRKEQLADRDIKLKCSMKYEAREDEPEED